ncbi:MAG: aromatic ring-hydroxylating dioxygenase subunit alpha [Solirubrobacterales bacterium]|nr:aromatic ring-hydroxylating dioxygenase subunit alpha [Solirubrobacterales bacterium]
MRSEARNGVPLELERADVEKTLERLRRATMLPPAAFTEQGVLDWELENIFSGWICIGHVSQVDEQGKYLMREIGSDSVVVIGGEDGRPRAFHNVCRHRGARIINEAEGTVKRRLRCPYHAWSYGLDGSLQAAPHMDGIEDFDPSCNGLRPVRLSVVGGLVIVDLSGEAPEPEPYVGELLGYLDHYRTGELVGGGRTEYSVNANWKGIAENYNECLHCPGIHPELNALSNYLGGEMLRGSGSWCGGSMRLTGEDAATMGSGGGHAGNRLPIEGLSEHDLGAILYFVLFPNALVSMHPDYVMLHTLYPRAPDRTEVICEWFFERRAVEAADFDPSDAIEFWDTTNRQDWEVCQLAQKGAGSRGYSAGRYSLQESDTHAFDVLVAESYMEALGDREGVPA